MNSKYRSRTLCGYQRYAICTMTCLALVFLYGGRHALSAILPHIIFVKLEFHNNTVEEVCPDAVKFIQPVRNIHEISVEWSKSERYMIFSSFYVGYILFHIPSGMLCDVYGARHFLSLGVLGSGFVTAAIPYVLANSPWFCQVFLQLLLGLFQGICIPAILSLLQHWAPVQRQTFLTSYGYSGGCLGSMLSSIITSYFLNMYWQFSFYIWACLILVWYLISIFLIYSQPRTHPRISSTEKLMIESQFGNAMPKKIPWKSLISDSATWALLAGQLGHNYLIFTVDTHLPEFFKRVIGFDLETNLYAFSIPYMFQWISVLASGYLGDYLIERNYIPVVYMRAIFAFIGNVVSSFFVLLATYMECNKPLILCCFTAAMIAKGCIFASLKANVLDITRHYSGMMQGIHNALPAVAGLASSQIIRYMCQRHTMAEWRKVFWLTFAMCCFTTTFYAIWSKGERASWDVVTKENTRRMKRTRR